MTKHIGWGSTVLADSERAGRHRQVTAGGPRTRARRARLVVAIGAIGAVVGIVVCAFAVPGVWRQADPPARVAPGTLSTRPGSYIGLYREGVPSTYTGVTAFTATTGVRPDVVTYYSGWLEAFQTSFATSVAQHGAVPLVQINPTGVSLAAIASGQYDGYLRTYAEAVRAYRRPVILSFGHEMNGNWYSWGHRHTSPAVFVAAWRHIVTVFRGLRVRNVTWMWTVNIIHTRRGIPSPEPWWPGNSYVTWVGLDGYYYSPSWKFAPLFGPTIAAVRALTHDPILIAETAAAPVTGQSEKIADLFAGIRLYGLLGFVWFDANRIEDWRLTSPAAIAAFRRNAQMYYKPVL